MKFRRLHVAVIDSPWNEIAIRPELSAGDRRPVSVACSYLGVSRKPTAEKYFARMNYRENAYSSSRTTLSLGYWTSEVQAAKAWDQAVICAGVSCWLVWSQIPSSKTHGTLNMCPMLVHALQCVLMCSHVFSLFQVNQSFWLAKPSVSQHAGPSGPSCHSSHDRNSDASNSRQSTGSQCNDLWASESGLGFMADTSLRVLRLPLP